MTEPHPNIRILRAAGLWRWVLALTAGSIVPLLLGCAAATGRGASEAQISAGRLQGHAESGVLRFLGIPFAAAPVDSLRFRSPQPAAAWTGTRDAVAFGPKCAQLKIGGSAIGILGEEDCLYLNVYRPNDDSRNRPVLFWIHGGGRRVGDGRRDVSAFVRETGSVVVSIQYRLDHQAFFAHPALTAEDPTRLASGNYGFEDAIAALQWVRDEIGAFGGDRDRVTIAGLFHRAIIQSGGGCWFPTQPIALAEAWGTRAAEKLGCSKASSIPDCLRETAVGEFYALGSMVENPFTPGSVEWSASQPILGGRSGHLVDGALFPRSWPDAFSIGAFHHVPLMVGTTEHEGRRVYGELMYQMGAREIGENEYVQALMGLLGSHKLARRAAERFPVGDPPDGVVYGRRNGRSLHLSACRARRCRSSLRPDLALAVQGRRPS
jgi:para-nitrobenzyl esterase